MLTLKKTSYTYRYFNWIMRVTGSYFNREQISLCAFFQNIFWRTLFLIALAVVVLVGTVFLAVVLATPYIYYFNGDAGLSPFLISAAVMWGMAVLILGAEVIDTKLEKRRSENSNQLRQPNLFREWLKAKKQKICPIINVIE